ncbi:MAG: amidohydrolase family protein [Myxococcota bacterium]
MSPSFFTQARAVRAPHEGPPNESVVGVQVALLSRVRSACRWISLLLLLAMSMTSTWAWTAEPAGGRTNGMSRPVPSAVTAFVGAQVLMPGSMTYAGATVLVQDDKIIGVGTALPIPPGAVTVELQGKRLLPGFIEPFSQLGLVEIPAESPSNDQSVGQPIFQPAFEVGDGFNPRSVHIPIARSGGVTSVVVTATDGIMAGQSGLAVLRGQASAGLLTEGALVRPRVAQHWRLSADALDGPFGSRSVFWNELREILEDARDYARRKPDFESNRTRAYRVGRLQLEALQPVLRGEQPVVVSVQRASDIEAVLRLADQYGLKVILAGASEAWMLREVLAQRQIPVILDTLANLPDNFDELRIRTDLATLLSQVGVPVMFSTFSAHNARLLWQRAGMAVRYGMSDEAALRGLTEVPADAFGLSDRGRIRVGAQADLVVWQGDPLELGSRVEQLYVGGKPVSLQSRQTLLRDRYRQVPPALPATRGDGR